MNDLSQILLAIERGERQATDELFPLVYDELRRLARQKLQHEKASHTLQATALVHEAYIRLTAGDERARWEGRRHFFAAAAEAMRRILVDSARRKRRQKRGGNWNQEALDHNCIAVDEGLVDSDLLELDAALDRLAEVDPRKAQLVKLRYFAGLTIDRAAEVLGIATSTADRDWSYARAWLFREISSGADELGN